MTTRLCFFVLMVALVITTLAPQGSARKISASRIPDPRDFFRGSPTRDKSILWRVHLALQLVKHPELTERQVQIILDTISLSTPEFFADSSDRPAKSKADEDLQSLSRRVLSAFPQHEAADLFGNVARTKATEDILNMYFDISALPVNERKASFRHAPSNNKSLLWRTHMALFLAKRPELDERQKHTILVAMSLATPEHFAIRSSEPAWKIKVRGPLRSLEEQIVVAFPLEDSAKIFATLGDDTESANYTTTYTGSVLLKSINYKPLSNSGLYSEWPDSRIGAQGKDNDKKGKDKKDKDKDKGPIIELERSSCACSTESDWCSLSSACTTGNCATTKDGCGTLWNYPCNGICR